MRDVLFQRGAETVYQGHIDATDPAMRAGALDAAAAVSSMSEDERQMLDQQIVEQAAAADKIVATAVAAARPAPRDRPSVATQLVDLMRDADLFHTQDDAAYATVNDGGKLRTLRVDSLAFRKLLVGRFYDQFERPPADQAISEAVACLEAKAVHRGECHKVFVRYAEHDGKIYVDLGNGEHPFVEIGPDGWKECASPPVKFVRPPSTLPLPPPRRGGSIKLLSKYVNVADRDWPLLAGFVLAAVMPTGPYPVLVLQGGQGTAKSTTMRMIANIVDPRIAGQRSDIRKPEDLPIAAANGWLISLDNLSHVRDETSDAICRMSTGGGFGTRRLYTDCDELLIEVCRPVAINGISELVTRGDLLDRSLVLYLPPIEGASRRSEADLKQCFEADLPLILGGLYDAVAASLRNRDRVELASQPRLLDVAIRVTAAERELGLAAGEFMEAYDDNRATSHLLALETHPVGRLLCEFVSRISPDNLPWRGTATELLDHLKRKADHDDKRHQHWPGNAKALSDRLRRLEPHLKHVGLSIEFHATKSKRLIILTRLPGFEQNWQQMSQPHLFGPME